MLKAKPPRKMPEDTSKLGSKLLRPDSPYRLIGDRLYGQYSDQDFIHLFGRDGKPAISAVDLLFVLALQAMENLSDRVAVERLQVDIGWKYALHLPLDYESFDFSVLSEFRDRLIEHNAERVFLTKLLEEFVALGLLKRRGRQRTDSLAVLTHTRNLTRLELQAETLRLAVAALQKKSPSLSKTYLPLDWSQKYGERLVGERLSEAECAKLTAEVGADGQWLLNLLSTGHLPEELRQLEQVMVLQKVWQEQFIIVEDKIQIRPPDDPPSVDGGVTQTPHDPQVRWSSKRGKDWRGYKLQVTQTCDEGLPTLIVDIALTPSIQSDQTALGEIAARQQETGTLPQTRLVDKGYTGGPNLLAAEERGEELLGPLSAPNSPQSQLKDGFTHQYFTRSADKQTVRCPADQESLPGRKDKQGNWYYRFARQTCAACPLRERCTSTNEGRRLRYSQYHQQHERAKERMSKAHNRELYKKRSGIEGCLSTLGRVQGLRITRYMGRRKNELRAILAGAGANLRKASAWLVGIRPQNRVKGCQPCAIA